MRIAYCTWLMPHVPNLFEQYPDYPFVVSVDQFVMNQVKGIGSVHDISMINIPGVSPYPFFPKIILKKVTWSYGNICRGIDIPLINIRIIRQIMIRVQLRKYLSSWAKGDKEKKVILTYNINPTTISALVKAKKKYSNVKIVLVIGDLVTETKGSLYQLRHLYYQRGYRLLQQFDGCIMVSPFMAKAIGMEEKPTLVIEGIYDKACEAEGAEHNHNDKIIFHAGTLERQYGVFHLLEAFSLIKDNNYRLWLAGGSSEADEIRKRCKADSRIRYYGFVPPQKVYELQKKSTIIVNPRTPNGEYTKYSFPSKTMEGLASGKPFLGYRLPGIPDEYYQYIQCIEGEDAEDLKDKMIEICELKKEIRDEIGRKARSFILKKKNCEVQGKKISRFLESL